MIERGYAIGYVIPKEGSSEVKADQLRDFAREQNLAQWKIPREIHIVKELPRSPTGKVLNLGTVTVAALVFAPVTSGAGVYGKVAGFADVP